MARIVTENDIGKGLAIEANKLVAKVSAAAGNAIQATEEGLFVAAPATPTVDVHLAGAEYDAATKTLKLKLSDDTTVEAPLADLLAKDALNGVLRGEEIQSLGGLTMGHLMKAD
jgi:hypothetical protein